MTDAPKEPMKPDGEDTEAFATHQRNFASIRMAYDLKCVK
jgi:hypothetical protein